MCGEEAETEHDGSARSQAEEGTTALVCALLLGCGLLRRLGWRGSDCGISAAAAARRRRLLCSCLLVCGLFSRVFHDACHMLRVLLQARLMRARAQGMKKRVGTQGSSRVLKVTSPANTAALPAPSARRYRTLPACRACIAAAQGAPRRRRAHV